LKIMRLVCSGIWFLSLALICVPAMATTTWQQTTGKIVTMAIAPTAPQTFYIATGKGLFKSINSGSSWSSVNNGLTDTDVTCLAIDPTNPQIVYTGTSHGGIFKTTDGGGSWSAVNSGLTDTHITCLVIDPKDSQRVYAGTYDSGVFSSVGGGSWLANSRGLLYPGSTAMYVMSLAVDPINPRTIYAGTYDGVFKSDNGGLWSKVSNFKPTEDEHVYSLAILPTNPPTIYAVTSVDIFKSTNGGYSWNPIRSLYVSKGYQESLAFDPTNSQTIYAGTINGLLKSIDGGSSWSSINNGLTGTPSLLAVDPTSPQTIYVSTITGIFKSTNGGGGWSAVRGLLNYAYVGTLVIDPISTQTVYAGISNSGVVKSTNGGGSWSAAHSGMEDQAVSSLAIDPTDSKIIYAAAKTGGVFKSINGGGLWSAIGPAVVNVHSLAIDPSNPQTIYVGSVAGYRGVFKSIDGGGSWNQVNSDISVQALAIDPAAPQTVYVGAFNGGGVFKSTDGGGSWRAANGGLDYPGMSVSLLAIDPTNPQTIYAVANIDGLFKSTDGGGFWSAVGPAGVSVRTLTVDPTSPQTIYAGTSIGMFKSTNGGGSWAAINDGLTNISVQSIAIDPASPQTIYAGTNGGGVFKGSSVLDVPTISAVPATTATVGTAYSFTPTATNAFSFGITGSIPPGLSFSAVTGTLSGTPTTVGSYSNIVISASNSAGTDSLPAFTITVALPMPTIFSTPTTTTVVDAVYSFTPSSTNASSFGITGSIPPGLSFSVATGTLSGTPTTAGNYSNIVISAINDTGTASLPAFFIIVIGVPDAPLNVTAVSGNGQSTVSFTPPAFDGGSPIISYTVTATPGNINAVGSSSPIIVSNLTNSTVYTFTVTANNEIGPSRVATATNLNRLSVTLSGAGNGSVNSIPSGIHCTSGTCAGNFLVQPLSLNSLASNGSQFSGWGGACTGTGTCNVTMAPLYQNITATFNWLPNARVSGRPQYYGLLQLAYKDSTSGGLIQAKKMTFIENLTLDESKTVTLKGGYDSTFSTQSGYAVLQGSLTISKGRFVADHIIIK